MGQWNFQPANEPGKPLPTILERARPPGFKYSLKDIAFPSF